MCAKDNPTPDRAAPHARSETRDAASPAPTAAPTHAMAPVPLARVVEPAETQKSYTLVRVGAIALVAALLAWVVWSWWDHRGLFITIEFAEPHRLEPGAPLTLNGVRVGEVTRFDLLENQLVSVRARLTASDSINGMIAREGSVFWIPRFEADLARGIRNVGAVFASEIAVRPGTGPRQYRFTGLEHEPPNVWLRDGELPIVLRARQNRGVTEGSAVLYRGLEIGEIVRTQLSRDSTRFEAWLRIFAPYRDLVRKDSHFVDSSGVNVEVGFAGMSVDMQSLQSVFAGSVQLFTPTEHGPAAAAGREFVLEPTADEAYYDWSPYIEFEGYQSMYDAPAGTHAPRLAKATLTWSYTRGWGWLAEGSGTAQGLVLATTAGVLAPLNLLVPTSANPRDVRLRFDGRSVPLADDSLAWQGGGLGLYEVARLGEGWPASRIRHAPEPESCTVYGAGGLYKVLDREYLAEDGGAWRVSGPMSFNAGWNGAAAISSRDGALVGILVTDEVPARIRPIPVDAPFFAEK